ncbi:MAG: LacI family DNA-binding transcriptional regulator, partial [Clostridia bacterium]|nr:LacI family DNA-binding transcriptional regulator [Clostridia bacterium]
MSATIADVAKLAGVAKSTVSKYINNGNLRPSERERVESAIRELNYVPNGLARGLKNLKSFTIGVIIPTLDSSFSAQILSAMEQELQQYSYGVLISDCRGDKDLELKALKFLQQKTVDAYVLLPSAIEAQDLNALKTPV